MQLPGTDDDELALLEIVGPVIHDEIEVPARQIGDFEPFIAVATESPALRITRIPEADRTDPRQAVSERLAGIAAAGPRMELQAIAACVIGGAQLLGGRGSLWSALFGALSLFALFTLLNLAGLPQALRDSIQGVILIAAVGASAWRDRRKT